MKVLLLGANGQLGQTFLADGRLAAMGELVATSRHGDAPGVARNVACDLADLAGLEAILDAEQPGIIVNAAAYTAVDKAEGDEETAGRINAAVPGLLGSWAATHDALVVHYSTDYVFPGDAATPYATDAATGPKGAYGRTKLSGEIALRNSGARHLILRTAWVYSTVGNNFLKTMLRLGAERDELRVVADQHGTPTSTTLIVEGTLAALKRHVASPLDAPTGTFHLTASGETTWHGFADAIFDEAVESAVLARRPTVVPIATHEFPTPAQRPAYSVLDNRSFMDAFALSLPGWREGLRDTVRSLRPA